MENYSTPQPGMPEQPAPRVSPPPPAPGPANGRGPLFWIAISFSSFFLMICIAGAILLALFFSAARSIVPNVSGIDVIGIESGGLSEIVLEGSGRNKIVAISIEGIITDRAERGIFQYNPSLVASAKKQLKKAASDSKVKAVILEINSPGGSITATDILHNEILKFKEETGKKVIVHMKGVAASGGYYIAAPADRIVAQPTTITGSIGVMMMLLNLEGLFKWAHVSQTIIKSGKFKDMGSSSRSLTDEEEKMLQEIVMEMYDRFVDVISEGRNMPKETVKALADGRVYTGRQALANGLIDSVGYMSDAIDAAKEEAGLTDAKIIRYRRKIGLSEFLLNTARNASRPTVMFDTESLIRKQAPTFMYLWAPTGSTPWNNAGP